jgi:formylglycine-generating enzyme required for sulfatase activity
MRPLCILLALLLPCARAADWVHVPRHLSGGQWVGGFDVARLEVSVEDFVAFLNDDPSLDYPSTAQIERRPPRRFRAKPRAASKAVAEVSPADAEAYCRWLSRRSGHAVRLPAPVEWETAARGGIDGAPYPWGWSPAPAHMAQFDAEGPAPRRGLFPANGFGLRDVAGNLYEWCAPDPATPSDSRPARGGAWSERDPALLRVDRQTLFPSAYRGRDVGFRPLREPSP